MSDQPESEGILKSAAKAVGAAAGKIAAVTKPHKAETPRAAASDTPAPDTAGQDKVLAPETAAAPKAPQTEKIAKLPAKNKSRLPRKQKKAQKKAAERAFLKE